MFRIRKIHDATSPANRATLRQVTDIMRCQFPRISEADIEKLPKQLNDPLRYRYRSVLFVAEDTQWHVKGFALFLHVADLDFGYLELISAAPGRTGGGVGAALYERVRAEARALGTLGVFFECDVDDPASVRDPHVLRQNMARLRFYERYGARPIANNDYAKPVRSPEETVFYLVYDDLGRNMRPRRDIVRRVVRAILERKYADLCTEDYVRSVVSSFRDDPIMLREPRYVRARRAAAAPPPPQAQQRIALIVNAGHDIHHVRERGYIEAPARLSSILREIAKTALFERIEPRSFPEKHVTAVHDPEYVEYLRRACIDLPPGQSIYPEVFPIRNAARPPRRLPLRAGYYCLDPFTPLNHNAYLAARGAVDCALTGATQLLSGRRLAYALVRPPGHHAERRAFGGFCYFNSAAVAAHFLSDYGRVAVLDVDFHHGNGTQQIFYERADVLTVSIHGHPNYVYPHFSGFEDEAGSGAGAGFNVNYPLPEAITIERYWKTLARALRRIDEFRPAFLVVALGLDTAKGDPTGSWPLQSIDFHHNGLLIGGAGAPTLVVQEGGYRTRSLGINARHFFEGLWEGCADVRRAGPRRLA